MMLEVANKALTKLNSIKDYNVFQLLLPSKEHHAVEAGVAFLQRVNTKQPYVCGIQTIPSSTRQVSFCFIHF